MGSRRSASGSISTPTALTGIAIALGITSCDPAAPAPELTIRLETEVEAWTLSDPARVECRLNVAARASGEEGSRADWGSAILELFGGPDRSGPVSRLTATAEEVAHAFGSASIEPGQEQEFVWDLQAPLPFNARLLQEYTLQPQGSVRTAEAIYTCGPASEPGPAPAIEQLEITTEAPEPGKTLGIRYRVRSGTGLWTVRVELSVGSWEDGWNMYLEPGDSLAADTVGTILPWLAPQGEVAVVHLLVTDVAGQTTKQVVRTVEPVLDLSPPAWRLEPVCDALCRVAGGSSFRLAGLISDAAPHRLIYRLGSPAILVDSVTFEAGSVNFAIDIPLPLSEQGRHPLSIRGVDGTGLSTPDTVVGELDVYRGVEASVDRINLTGLVTDVQMDEARGVLYAVRPFLGDLVVLNLIDLEPVQSIPIAGEPSGLDLSLTGDSLLIALAGQGSIAVVDPDGARATEYIRLTALDSGFEPLSIRVAGNGHWLVHAERRLIDHPSASDMVLLEVQPATGEQVLLESAQHADIRRRVLRTDDRSRLVTAVECLRIRDGFTGSAGPCGQADIKELATDARGTKFSDAGHLRDENLQLIPVWYAMVGYSSSVDLTPEGGWLLVNNLDFIDVLRTQENAAPELRLWGAMPGGRLDVSESGAFAIAWGDGSLDRLDVEATSIAKIDLTPLLDLP